MVSGTVIEARGLTKRYGDHVAVDAIDFEVRETECFGFLGPNGAGKTSAMKMLYCATAVSAGSLSLLGLDVRRRPREVKGRIGVVPQELTLDSDLRVAENLHVHARYFGIPAPVARRRAAELLDFFELAERRHDDIESLSGGMKQRLLIARALMNEPEILILDEPTTGLDPQARHTVWDKLRQLKDRGVTLLLTTHYLDEAEQLCDRLIVMDRGRIVAAGEPRDLIAAHVGREVLELPAEPPERVAAPDAVRSWLDTSSDGLVLGGERLRDRWILFGEDADALNASLDRAGVDTRYAYVRRANLEDVFLKLTGRGLGE